MKDIVRRGTRAGADAIIAGAATALAASHPELAMLLNTMRPFLGQVIDALGSESAGSDLRRKLREEFIEEMKLQMEPLARRLVELERAGKLPTPSYSAEEIKIIAEQLIEAAQASPQEERRKMLAAAAVGALRPDVEMEMKARAEQALAQLHPSDVVALRKFSSKFTEAEFERMGGWRGIKHYWEEQPLVSRLSLLRSGCVYMETEFNKGSGTAGRSGLHIPPQFLEKYRPSHVGRAVLLMLETYAAETSAAAEAGE